MLERKVRDAGQTHWAPVGLSLTLRAAFGEGVGGVEDDLVVRR